MIFVRNQNFKTCLLTKVEISETQSLCSRVITCQQVGEGICDWRVAGRGWLASFLDAWGMAGGSCLMSGGDLEKKTFFKLRLRTHDLRHMTKAMLATLQHNHLTICPYTLETATNM